MSAKMGAHKSKDAHDKTGVYQDGRSPLRKGEAIKIRKLPNLIVENVDESSQASAATGVRHCV